MDNQLHNLSIHETRKLLDNKKVSSLELTNAFLERINRLDPLVGAYVTVTEESAINQAKQADEIISMGNALPLTGIPLQIKDNIATNGIRTTCSSRMLEHFIPPYHSKVTEKLLNEYAVIIGKGNMDEFAMGSSTENSAFHVTHNPWDLSCVPGGSSGGPAAAVAASEAMGSLGSDTGGSIRQPASLCGIVGMKPTYGLVSRYGLVAFASSFDQIGPLTKNVADCALLLKSIAGHDPKDSTSLNYESPNYLEKLNGNIHGLRIGVPKEYFVDGIDTKVKDAVVDALHIFERLGAKVDFDVSLPLTRYALPVYYIIAPSECSANLARYDGVKYGYSESNASGLWDALEKTREYGFGPEVKRRIMLGTYSLSSGYYDAYYMKAGKVRTLISREFQMAFEKYDVLITPTSPSTAFKIGTKTQTPLQMYLSDICTIPANIAGIPAISIPCGFSEGLPIGLQIMGPALGEETVLQAAYAYELATDWHKIRPNLPID